MRGGPGTGKTMLGLHFLAAGAAHGEKNLFISLEETEQQIREDAAAVGIDLTGLAILDLSPARISSRKTSSTTSSARPRWSASPPRTRSSSGSRR